jgi:hypothetical protein
MRLRLRLPAVTAFLLVAANGAAGVQSPFDVASFTGTWKENVALRQQSISPTLTYTFAEQPDGYVEITRGGVQLRDRVRFDGKDYPTPEIPGRTVSWTRVSDTEYHITIKRNGAVVTTGTWVLSEGGTRLIQSTTPTRVDGRVVTDVTEYERTTEQGTSLNGIWRPIRSRAGEPDEFILSIIEGNAVQVFYPRNRNSFVIRPDGKEYPDVGSKTLPDMTRRSEALGRRTLRYVTRQPQGTPLQTTLTVSEDGKTMRVTTQRLGTSDTPAIFLYEKQN